MKGLIESDTFNGAAFIGMAMPTEGLTLEDTFEEAIGQTGFDEENVTFVGEPSEVMIDGNRGIQRNLELVQDGMPLTGKLTMVENGDFFNLLLTIVSEDEEADYWPQLDAIVASAELSEPNLEGMFEGFVDEFGTGDMEDAAAVAATAGGGAVQFARFSVCL